MIIIHNNNNNNNDANDNYCNIDKYKSNSNGY